MSRTLRQAEETPRERRRQRDGSMGGFNLKLGIPSDLKQDDRYVYRWVNDEGTRVHDAFGNDYDFVDENGHSVDKRNAKCRKQHVGTLPDGSALVACLMRKDKEWHTQDRAQQQAAIDEKMKGLQREAEESRAKPTGLNVQLE